MVVNGWQIASTIGTFLAVAVALFVAVTNLMQRRTDRLRDDTEENDRALAQARLVVTGYGNPGVDSSPDDWMVRVVLLPVTNHSDRPILRVVGEHWQRGKSLDEKPASVIVPVLLPGQEHVITVPINANAPEQTAAWRIRWTDADGRSWCWDRFPQDAPDRYTGQPPTPYGATS